MAKKKIEGAELSAKWGKIKGEKVSQIIFEGPNGPDSRLLAGALSEEFVDDLRTRGYDISTLTFSIIRPPIKKD